MAGTYALRAYIAAPTITVYDALTTTSALEIWFAEHAAVSLPDDQFEFWGCYTPPECLSRQRLLSFQPNRLLVIGWLAGATEHSANFRLEPVDRTRTLLTFSFPSPPVDPSARALIRDFWFQSIMNLVNYAEGRDLSTKHDFCRPTYGEARAETRINAAPEAVFSSLMQPVLVNRWIATAADIEPQIGGRYSFGWNHGPEEIIDLTADKVLAYSWRANGEPRTTVRWELSHSFGETLVTLTHTGFPPKSQVDSHLIAWRNALSELKRMHELGDKWRKIEVI